MRPSRIALLGGLIPMLFLLLMVLMPMSRLAWEGWTAPEVASATSATPLSWWHLWDDPHWRFRLQWSLAQAAVSTGLTLILGLPVAWVLARYAFWGRAWVLRLLLLPFVVPTLVAALGVLALWGPSGWWGEPLNAWLHTHIAPDATLEDSPVLLLIGNLFFNLCVVVRAAVEALGQVSAHRLAAARTLGATPWRAFWRIEWPAIRLAVVAALCLVFLYCFSGMGLALVLGGQRWATLEVEIYTLVAHELRLAEASGLAVWSMALGLGLALLFTALSARLSHTRRPDTIALRPVRTLGQRLALGMALTVLALCCGAPLLATLARAMADVPATWQVWQDEDTVAALHNTLQFSAVAVLSATALGLLHGFAAHHARLWYIKNNSCLRNNNKDYMPFFIKIIALSLSASSWLPFVASPVVVAFGLLLLYPEASGSGTVLIAAYTLLAYPFVTHSVMQGLSSLPAHWFYAAHSLGAGPLRVWWRITLPLLRPALRRGMAFAAATALGEFAVSLFLSRPEWTTLTTLIYQHLGRPGASNLHAAHALSLLLMALALGVFLALDGRTTSSLPCEGEG